MNVLRVTLPGYNALSETDDTHYSVRSDKDNILIKEFARGSVTLAPNTALDITHNLGYVPDFRVYANGRFLDPVTLNYRLGWIQCISSQLSVPIYGGFATSTKLSLENNDSISVTFKYFIFYDKQL